MIITKLEIGNIMGVKAVVIEPKNLDVIKIEGKNRVGKTTTLNAIPAVLDGIKHLGKEPLREGAKEGFIRLFLADPGAAGFDEKRDTLIAERIVTPKGDRLKVTSPKGAEYKKPATMLAEFFSAVSIDPQAFKNMGDKKRIDTLLAMTGEADKVAELDARRAGLYESRRDINRSQKDAEALSYLDGVRYSGDEKPEGEKSVPELVEKLSNERERCRRCSTIRDRYRDITTAINEHETAIKRLREEEIELREEYNGIEGDSRVDEFQVELGKIERFNADVRDRNAARESAKRRDDLKQKSFDLTQAIESVDCAKTAILASLPIKGIAIDDGIVCIDNRPFDDHSESEKYAIGIRIAAALNPKLRVVMVADGAELDSESWKEVATYAKKHKLQIWTAVVADKPSGNGFFIEAGTVNDG